MAFGLCNAPSSFQRCMMAIFSYMTDNFREAFVDDFFAFECSFDSCLANLFVVLQRNKEVNLV